MEHDTQNQQEFDASAEPAYIVEEHKCGLRIRRHPDPSQGGVNLFALDEILASLQERLIKEDIAVLVGVNA